MFVMLLINLLLNKPFERHKKRIFDIVFSILTLGLSPILLLFQKKPLHFFNNWFQVLLGRKTWVFSKYKRSASWCLSNVLNAISNLLKLMFD